MGPSAGGSTGRGTGAKAWAKSGLAGRPKVRPSGVPRIRFAATHGRLNGAAWILYDGPARICIASNALPPWRVY